MDDQGKTPMLRLLLCLAIVRGGQAVPEEDITRDAMEWIKQHGEPTWDTVNSWADDCFELKFALQVMGRREPVGQ